MTDVRYSYRPEVLKALLDHGIRPRATTPPALVHEFVNDLYRFELRRLRSRQLKGDILRDEYTQYVVELRKQYLLVSVPLKHWTTTQN